MLKPPKSPKAPRRDAFIGLRVPVGLKERLQAVINYLGYELSLTTAIEQLIVDEVQRVEKLMEKDKSKGA